ncbi:unnamed protein product [Ilex paraguariensis]|uniref:DC1 domain-containing protein n=1 Tax=Ilex paraguariensis TaxID=185542 RepID=A0ABC8TM07_9AQUA
MQTAMSNTHLTHFTLSSSLHTQLMPVAPSSATPVAPPEAPSPTVVRHVDLHVHCAFLPPKVNHRLHPHKLSLSYGVPADQKLSPQACKICNQMLDSKNWSYYCLKCEFRVHTFCATKEVKPGLYQMDEATESVAAEAVAVAAGSSTQQSGCGTNGVEVETELTVDEEVLVELYKLQLQRQMIEQAAQMMAAMALRLLIEMTPVCPFVKAARPDDASSKKPSENQNKQQVAHDGNVKQESNESASISPKCPFGYDSQTFKLGPLSCMICQALLFDCSKCVPCSHVYCK